MFALLSQKWRFGPPVHGIDSDSDPLWTPREAVRTLSEGVQKHFREIFGSRNPPSIQDRSTPWLEMESPVPNDKETTGPEKNSLGTLFVCLKFRHVFV